LLVRQNKNESSTDGGHPDNHQGRLADVESAGAKRTNPRVLHGTYQVILRSVYIDYANRPARHIKSNAVDNRPANLFRRLQVAHRRGSHLDLFSPLQNLVDVLQHSSPHVLDL